MEIQAFIFNWKGHSDKARDIEALIGSQLAVTVINSEENLAIRYPHWIHLGDDAYFSEQWNTALALFRGDFLLHIQADASCSDFPHLIDRARATIEAYPVGVYEPEIVHSAHEFDRALLNPLGIDLYEVPMTDCTCWMISGELLRDFPAVTPSINKFGWGIDVTVAAKSRLHRKLCIRDYGITVQHPRHRGYSRVDAAEQASNYMNSLSQALRSEVTKCFQERSILLESSILKISEVP